MNWEIYKVNDNLSINTGRIVYTVPREDVVKLARQLRVIQTEGYLSFPKAIGMSIGKYAVIKLTHCSVWIGCMRFSIDTILSYKE